MNTNKYFGAFSVYKNNQTLISALSAVDRKLFSNPEIQIGTEILFVSTRELKNPSQLRIPASFFEQVNDTTVEAQKKFIRKILKDETLASSCFTADLPLQSKVVSKFGSFRRLPTGQEYFHTGLDLRAKKGTNIYAMANGKVRTAQDFIVAGNAVIVEHGYGIFSKYFHLSEIAAKKNQSIKKGILVGKSGATGRVEAPHLHWEVSWKGISMDPQEFINLWKTVCS